MKGRRHSPKLLTPILHDWNNSPLQPIIHHINSRFRVSLDRSIVPNCIDCWVYCILITALFLYSPLKLTNISVVSYKPVTWTLPQIRFRHIEHAVHYLAKNTKSRCEDNDIHKDLKMYKKILNSPKKFQMFCQ